VAGKIIKAQLVGQVWPLSALTIFPAREASHKQIYDQGSSPQISVCNPRGSPRGLPLGFQTEIHFKPRASPQEELRLGRLPTSRVTTREAPHKQNYDQGAYPQAELRPGSWLAGWLAELAGWLAGWLGGWLAGLLRPRKAQKGPERPREAQRSGAWIEQACRALGWGLYSIVFYCLLLYSNVFYCILLYSIVFYCILLYSIVFYCILL